MADKKAAKKFDNIIDAMLDEREPDWKDLGLNEAHESGEEQLDRTHQYVDTDFMDDIAESASKHTPVWGPKSGAHTYEQRISDKEAAQPRVNAVKADWRKDARRDSDAYKSEHGDNDSLMAEVTESLESALGKNSLAENSAEKKSVSDAQVQKYVKDLLNQGMSPSKIAAQLNKLAEIELFNHQMATDYLQRNAGLMGLAYLEPNTYMDKSSPTYEHTAAATESKTFDTSTVKGIDAADKYKNKLNEKYDKVTVHTIGLDRVRIEGTPSDGEHTAAGYDDWLKSKPLSSHNQWLKDQEEANKNKASSKNASSNDCVQQKKAWDNAGIKPQAHSVKQVSACSGCTYFKKDARGKSCNLYHLPVVANTQELTQIVNHLTPGVPEKRKHAALVSIANGDGKRVQPVVASAQTNIVKTADAKVKNQSKRASHEYGDVRETSRHFEASHVAKMHEKGASLEQIYKWASEKFGDVDTSLAFRGFVQSFKKDAKGKVVIASGDLKFLNSIGIRSEAYTGAAKCASCPTHFSREARESEPVNMRVDGKFAQRTASATASLTEEKTSSIVITAAKVRKLHQAGHSVSKIYARAASKVGSVEARKAVAGFVEDMKKRPGKTAVSESDRAFLVGKLGFKPEAVRMLDPQRRPVTQVVASVPDDKHVLGYPGMDKQAGEKKATDGHAILAEYDLAGRAEMQDIDTSGHKLEDVQMNDTFKVELD